MFSKIFLNIILFFIVTFLNVNIQAAMTWLEYEVARFDNSVEGIFTSDLKSKRYDKVTFGISGTVEIIVDFSNDWEAELVLFHSAKGNNQFVKTPYKVPKDNLCNIVDGIYIKCGAAKDVASASDLPMPKSGESLCNAYKKGNYTIQQFLLSEKIIPKFLQPGYYKAQFTASKKNSDVASTFILHVKLY